MASKARTEIYKRRGAFLQPLNIGKENSTDYQQPKFIDHDLQMSSAWESHYENTGDTQWPWNLPPNDNTLHPPTEEQPPNETYEKRLARHKAFFKGDGLARGCDTLEDKHLTELFYQRLLEDVAKQSEQPDYRGLAQVISFWEDVRQQLAINDEDAEAYEWPEGYPGEPHEEQPSPAMKIRTDLPRWSIFRIAQKRDEVGDIIDLYLNKTPTVEVNGEVVVDGE